MASFECGLIKARIFPDGRSNETAAGNILRNEMKEHQ